MRGFFIMNDIQTTLSTLYRLYHRELGYSAAAAIMCCLRHIQMQHSWREIFINSVMAALMAAGAESVLSLLGIQNKNTGFLIACMIGYMGVGSIMSRFDAAYPNKEKRQEEDETRAPNDTE